MDINKSKNLKNKRILITAGATWVALDEVRVISNTASGETGLRLAKRLVSEGAKVTLLLGPIATPSLRLRARVMNFKFFEELKSLLEKELKGGCYDILIHSAAVSDYRPEKRLHGKVSATKKVWRLNLIPTEKLIQGFRKLDKDIFLVGFKFEPKANKDSLVREAHQLMQSAALDLVVANTRLKKGNNYQAFILSNREISGPYSSKNNLSVGLIKKMKEGLCRN